MTETFKKSSRITDLKNIYIFFQNRRLEKRNAYTIIFSLGYTLENIREVSRVWERVLIYFQAQIWKISYIFFPLQNRHSNRRGTIISKNFLRKKNRGIRRRSKDRMGEPDRINGNGRRSETIDESRLRFVNPSARNWEWKIHETGRVSRRRAASSSINIDPVQKDNSTTVCR